MTNSIVESVFKTAFFFPGKTCLADDFTTVTYSEYCGKITALADFFDNGCGGRLPSIQKGDIVVVEAVQSVTFLAIELALHLLGAVFVPLEQHAPAAKLMSVADVCRAKLIISDNCDELSQKKYAVIPYNKLNQLSVTCNPKYDTFISLFEDRSANALTQAISDCFRDFDIRQYNPHFSFPPADSVSEILFSTGTTGKEKGIVLTHRSAVAVAENIAFAVDMKEDNVELIPSPLNHSHGLRSYYANMLIGATVIILGSMMNFVRFFECMDIFKVTAIDLVPTALSVLLKRSRAKLADYRSTLRYIEFGSAKLNESDKFRIKELLPKTPLYNFFGSTESGRSCCYNFNVPNEKPCCIGKPTRNSTIVTVDENGNEITASKDLPGLIACKGLMNMTCYYEDESETLSVMRNELILSKDLAYFDEDGDIILLGRKGDVINSGGRKISPDEIEDAAKTIEGIKDCGCIGAEDAILGSVPILWVQTALGVTLSEADVLNQLRGLLESFKLPKHVYFADEIPRTFNGKLLRRTLTEMYENAQTSNRLPASNPKGIQ